jgi:hypothetical protein
MIKKTSTKNQKIKLTSRQELNIINFLAKTSIPRMIKEKNMGGK